VGVMDKKQDKIMKVGIGLPVYNNEKYIVQTLDSILSQSYKDITLYILDDASTDRTPEICKEYAKRDKRIIYSANEKNIGPFDNHAKVLSMASEEYFTFARGHEILSQTVIEDCLQILENQKDVVLAFPSTQWIDMNGHVMKDKYIGVMDTRGFDVATRCVLVFWDTGNTFYGLSKTELMKKGRIYPKVYAADKIFLLKLAIRGSFAHVHSATRCRRYLYSNEPKKKLHRRYKTQNPDIKGMLYFPLYMCASILSSPISRFEKIKILILSLLCAPLRYITSIGQEQYL
jgi:glycosyltransferase involved in cell wall biosynthesis